MGPGEVRTNLGVGARSGQVCDTPKSRPVAGRLLFFGEASAPSGDSRRAPPRTFEFCVAVKWTYNETNDGSLMISLAKQDAWEFHTAPHRCLWG